jgi:hypothetical protein
MEAEKTAYRVLIGNLKKTDQFEDICVDGDNMKRWGGWEGLAWVQRVQNGLFWNDNESAGSKKG